MTDTKTQIVIGREALLRRVNRRLGRQGQQLFKSRSNSARRDVGDWYIVNLSQSTVSDSGLELESCARKLGALAAWERLDEEVHQ